uniref:Protein TENP n=1 Tax=Dromaius novaehollandiae TaxID=8790 RepID=A0A060NZG6_DRONO|nr:protein TENP [Dromaius novaehollandiae]
MGKICALGIVLSLLAPALATKSPDCGGILSPSGLSYFAEVSKQHVETILVQDLTGRSVSDLLLGSPKPTRNQIDSVKVVDLSLLLIPEAGLRLSIDADLGIAVSPSTSKVVRLSILADLHVERNPEGNLELTVSACKPTVEEVQSTEESESESLSSEADKEIDVDKICLEVSKLLVLPNELLASLTAQLPVTASCQLQYLPLAAPVISEQGITVSLQTVFLASGTALPLPVSPAPFSMPEAASASASHLTLALSEHYYTSLFLALAKDGAFNVTASSPLTTAAVAQKISQIGSLFREDLPVRLKATFRSSPRVLLEEGKAALKLFLTVHVGVGSPAFQNVLSVSVDMSAGLLLSVTDVKMMISAAAIEDVELSLAASDVGPVPDALLKELFLSTIREEILAQMNAVLSEGIYLPHVPNFIYTDVNVVIHKDYVLIPCNLKLQPKTGGQIITG